MYFRDKSFNRLTDLAHFRMEITPPNSTILVAEITCQPGDPYWTDEAATKKEAVTELISEGLFQESDLINVHVFKSENGYPIYEVGYEERLKTALAAVKSVGNFESIGRQGRFAYVNTHIAMKMGYEAAARAAAAFKAD
jgi:protoporphyrinogen oxidase